jgi:hypothetical protein
MRRIYKKPADLCMAGFHKIQNPTLGMAGMLICILPSLSIIGNKDKEKHRLKPCNRISDDVLYTSPYTTAGATAFT